MEGTGAVGGMIGHMEGSTVENGMAQVTVRTTGRAAGAQALAGGIAGEAADDSRIIDCQVRTGDNSTSRIQGTDATVGGIVGFRMGRLSTIAYVKWHDRRFWQPECRRTRWRTNQRRLESGAV